MTSPEVLSIPETSVHRTVLANGLTVLIRRDTSAPVAAIVTFVNAGYFDETDDVVGIAHVLEHMYFKGTPTRAVGAIARETKAAGGYLNAGTIYDHTVYYTVLPASGFIEGLDVPFDAYANSVIDADELRRELEVIIQEAKRKADNPAAVVTETLYELLHDRHRMRRWRIGREPGLRALDRDAMMQFYRNFYHPGNTVLAIVGDVDPDAALAAVVERHGGLSAGAPTRDDGPAEIGEPGFRYREWSGDIAQTQIAMGWRTPPTLDDASPGLDMLSLILSGGRSSRLYRAVREQKLASSVSAYNYTPTTLGVFVVHAESSPERAAEAARAIWSQLRAVRDEGVTAEELERARRVFESRWIRRLEDMEGQANYLAEWEALGDWRSGDAYLERIRTVSTHEVQSLARRFLDPEQASVAIYRPAAAGVIASDAAAARALLDDAPKAVVLPTSVEIPTPADLPPALTAEREVAGVRVYRTSTGVPVLVRSRPGALFYAGAFFLGGARDEPAEQAGLTTMLVRTSVKGTAARTAEQIAEAGEMLGGSVSGATGGESFGWSISVPSANARDAVALLADVVQKATIPEASLETERTLALADLEAMRDDMYRYPVRLATGAAYAGHPYGVPVSGDENTLPWLTAADIRAWHDAHVLHGQSVIAVVGDGDPDALAGLVAARFDSLQGGTAADVAAPVWPAELVQRVEQREKAQTALTIFFPSPARTDDDRFAADMIAGVASGLGGRFFDELRDRQSLGYTVHAFSSERSRAGTFVSYIATSPEKEETARAGLLAEFAKLRESPVTQEELDQARTYAIGTHAIRQQSGAAVLADMVDAWFFGRLEELEDYESQVRAVTASAMQDVARRYFDPARRVEGIIRGTGRAV